MLEALILASTNPQYDKRLFIDLPVQYMKTTSSEHLVYINCSECQNKNKKTIYVHNMFWDVVFMYWTGKSMNNLILFCGLVDPRISASDKDLPELEGVPWGLSRDWPGKPFDCTEFCTPKIIENLLLLRI